MTDASVICVGTVCIIPFHYRVIPIIALGLSLGMIKLDEDESSNLSHTNLDDAILIQGLRHVVKGD
jgi:hypothetical protein